jgi:ribonuclease T2
MKPSFGGIVALALVALGLLIGVGSLFLSRNESHPPAMVPLPPERESEPAPSVPGPPLTQAPEAGPVSAGQFASAPSGSGAAADGDFAYYIVALSWSPTYCLEQADPKRDRRQCSASRPYAFVLHGLWPQRERGYPENCQTASPRVPDDIIDGILDIMPSRGLAGHQWRKHGACTGLSQAAYFAASRKAFEAVRIPSAFSKPERYVTTTPKAVEQAFLASNPGLSAQAVTVTCSRKHLREVRVCLTKDLAFRACGRDAQRDCDQAQIVMPPSRGG